MHYSTNNLYTEKLNIYQAHRMHNVCLHYTIQNAAQQLTLQKQGIMAFTQAPVVHIYTQNIAL